MASAASLVRETVNRYFLAFRRLIRDYQLSQKEQILGVIEVDESFFGPAKIRAAPALAKGAGARSNSLFSALMSAMAWSTPTGHGLRGQNATSYHQGQGVP